MVKYVVMCRSITSAQRCARLLEKNLIRAVVIRAPRALTETGCAYAIVIGKKFKEAVELLQKNDMPFGKIYEMDGEGEYREVSL